MRTALQAQSAAENGFQNSPLPDFSRKVVCIEGLLCDAVTLEEAKRQIVASIRGDRRCNMVTPNTNFLRLIRSDANFRDAALSNDLSVIDGMPLVWLARLLGLPVRQRVAGSDLFDALRASGERMSAFFFGATDDVGCRVRERLNEANSAILCAGTLAPGFGSVESMSDPETLRTINAAAPDLLVVSVGARKGMLWLSRNESQLTAPVVCNLGATINFVARDVKRAPELIRRAGIEWLWRIKEQPTLWSRYALDLVTLVQVLLRQVLPWLIYSRIHRPSDTQLATARVRHYRRGNDEVLEFFGAWTAQNILPARSALTKACVGQDNLVVCLDGVTGVDAAFLGLLLLAYGYRRRINRGFSVEASRRQIRKMLRLNGCEYLLSAGRADPSMSKSDDVERAGAYPEKRMKAIGPDDGV
ncbi:WecB/TagA/CpsF family glycosyltransferase [Bradyrhizobium sp. USDA 4451]